MWRESEKKKEFGGGRMGKIDIKKTMRDRNAPFGGELSGHFYFRFDFDGKISMYDSGIVTAIWVMRLLSAKGKKLSELVEPMRKYSASGEINSKVEDKEGKMKELGEIYKDGNVSWLDGIRVDFDDWWFNVRASNTEPLLRLNLEAKTEEMMIIKRDEILKLIRG